MDVKSCCRLCLNNKVILIQLIDSAGGPRAGRMKEMCKNISLLFNIKVKCNDEISTLICGPCAERVSNFMFYRKICTQNQSQLQSSLEIQKKIQFLKHEDPDEDCYIVSVFNNSSSLSSQQSNMNISTPNNTLNELKQSHTQSMNLNEKKRLSKDTNDSGKKKLLKLSATVVAHEDSMKRGEYSQKKVLNKNATMKNENVKGVQKVINGLSFCGINENVFRKKKIPQNLQVKIFQTNRNAEIVEFIPSNNKEISSKQSEPVLINPANQQLETWFKGLSALNSNQKRNDQKCEKTKRTESVPAFVTILKPANKLPMQENVIKLNSQLQNGIKILNLKPNIKVSDVQKRTTKNISQLI